MGDKIVEPKKGEILLYRTNDGDINLGVLFSDETVWLTQAQMSELFQRDRSVISRHISNIYEEKELDKESTIAKYAIVQSEGNREVKREVVYYNLDMIIAVGYRVRSREGTLFRKWATSVLSEYTLKGFVLDDDRLKNGKHFGKDYFDELLERIREIRASERRFYQKITDIYAECSIDYDSKSDITNEFYATVQNKLHYAITGQTAAEIIESRVDATKGNMGLTSWKDSPNGKILKSDIHIAKNYLRKEEIDELNRIVNMYLDYAENQAKKQIPMKMKNWVEKLDAFLEFNEYEILQNKGKVSAKVAKELANEEYNKFRVKQDREYKSDFDREIEKYLK
ncbi:MAG: virulence RhuM family protein [Tissierellia bacterium]|nr:virulence RhuM family protein [Tissierellia bacterium]